MLDHETVRRIKGEVEEKDLIYIGREQLFEETRAKIKEKTKNNVWEVGYWSTDDEEDNDSDYEGPAEDNDDEEEEEYDEEDEEDEEVPDPTVQIKQELYEKGLQPEERKYLSNVSDIEKKILEKN
jgi:hypothetical protein